MTKDFPLSQNLPKDIVNTVDQNTVMEYVKTMNKEPDGFLQYPPDQIEEMQKLYEWRDIDGIISFPFHYLRVSNMERIYIPIKRKRKYNKKEK
jgi:hypothetical protein